MDNVRELAGRIDIIYGNEEYDGGVTITRYTNNGSCLGEVSPELLANLIKIKERVYNQPIIEFGKHAFTREAAFVNLNHILDGNITENNVFNVELTNARHVRTWVLGGVKYEYNDSLAHAEVYEFPSEFIITLITDITHNKQYRLFKTDLEGLLCMYNYDPILNVKGELLSREVITSHMLMMDLQSDDSLIKSIQIIITGWNVSIMSDRGLMFSNELIMTNEIVTNPDGTTSVADPQFLYGPSEIIKLTVCYDSNTEMYTGMRLAGFEVNRSLASSSGSIKYGLVSNSLTATIFNDEKDLKDGHLADMMTMGKRVIPQVIEDCRSYKIGTYYVSEWDIPIDSSWAKLTANDRLYDLHDIKYQGLMPQLLVDRNASDEITGIRDYTDLDTAYHVLIAIFMSINNTSYIPLSNYIYTATELDTLIIKSSGLADVKYTAYLNRIRGNATTDSPGTVLVEGLDLSLLDVKIPHAYLEQQSLWSALESVAKATLSYGYLDYGDKLMFLSELQDSSYYIYNNELCKRSRMSGDKGAFVRYDVDGNPLADKVNQTITKSNAFTMAKPVLRSNYATEIDMQITTYDFEKLMKEKITENKNKIKDLITYYFSDEEYTLDYDVRTYKFYVPKYVDIRSINYTIVNQEDADSKEESKVKYTIIGTDVDNYCFNRNNELYFNVQMSFTSAFRKPNETDSEFMARKLAYKPNPLSRMIISGLPVESVSQDVSYRNANLVQDRTHLSYDGGVLVNNIDLSRQISKRLMSLYDQGRSTFTTEWIGDMTCDINDSISFYLPSDFSQALYDKYNSMTQEELDDLLPNAEDQINFGYLLADKYTYTICESNIAFDGGLRQRIKSVSNTK